jgi:hypothetical protein
MRWVRLEILLFALVAMTGCATTINGSKQTVSFMSDPSGATVTVGGEFTSRTPVALPLGRGKDYEIMFQKEGYESQSLVLKSSFSHWGQATLGNIWNWIIPGLIVDTVSGGAYEFDQQLINSVLVKSNARSTSPTTLEPNGTNKIDGKPTLSDQQKARDYIVVAYKGLIEELTKDEKGEYVRSLLNLLKIPDAQQADAITKIRWLSEGYKNIPIFADRVVEMFLK